MQRKAICIGVGLFLLTLWVFKRSDHAQALRIIPSGIMYARSSDGYAIRIIPTKWKVFHISERIDPAHPMDWLALGPLQLYRVPTNTEFQ